DRAVTRRREIDHLAQGGSILAAGDNENPGLDRAGVPGLVEEGPDVASLVDVVEVSADVHPVHIRHPLPPDCTFSVLGLAWEGPGRPPGSDQFQGDRDYFR